MLWDACVSLTLTSVVQKRTRIDKFGWLQWLHNNSIWCTWIWYVYRRWLLMNISICLMAKTGQVNELTQYTHTHVGVIFKWRSKYLARNHFPFHWVNVYYNIFSYGLAFLLILSIYINYSLDVFRSYFENYIIS